MDWDRVWPALLGGLMIGVASAGLLALTAKTAGISGIIGGILQREKGELGWKSVFLLGLVAGGIGLAIFMPEQLAEKSLRPLPLMILAGLLVGFGTRFGGGCTSGHGVCGIGRLSLRSILGTITFIAVGALTVVVARALEGL
jgi:hypothetical protein